MHPLDPLTTVEISKSSGLIREKHPNKNGWIFNSITLLEPPKNVLLPFLSKEVELNRKDMVSIPRKSFTILIEKGTGKVYEAVINLSDDTIERFDAVPSGFQPTLTPEDCIEAEKICKSNSEVQLRCLRLGLEDMDLVVGDPWSIGYNGEPEFASKRAVQLFMYARMFPEDNHYAHPLDFVVVVDLNAFEVILIEDLPIHTDFKSKREDEVEIPKETSNYDPKFLPEAFLRKDLKPLQVIQPEGPSFTVEGNEIQWQLWNFRISFNYREGLVLHNVSYRDGNKTRPLFYRISLSEMVVPYGDPRPPYHRKSAFDIGDYGLGFCANSLLLGCDCLGTIRYFDGILNTHDGKATVIKNVICLHEEDAGTLHKHTEYRTGKVNVTRSRRLVLSFVVTVVNYEYAFYYTFYQDGTISFEIKATGELSTNLLAEGVNPANYGSVVFDRVAAQYHQHIFCARVDPMIDGSENTVSVVDVKALDEPFQSDTNPYGQGFAIEETPLKTSLASVTDIKAETSRFWKISNYSSIHPYTQKPVGWKLISFGGSFQRLLAGPGSFIRKRAGFATHSVWVTPYNDSQLYAGGLYINQSPGGQGLESWVKEDNPIEDKDIVLYHSFGVTHIPRVEDFPIMPVETFGYTLKPVNFFLCNPGLSVPPPCKSANKSRLA
ncbi:copper amine oxidase 1-like [Bradysia coprophila]|uniref:copper amine oxidase 1-like n=1 Tax=Bradysia coprophila TaxID=38358 RepID=UPI00187DD724|nr:copper amine oxidase 1-like [Bradysia coprophila]